MMFIEVMKDRLINFNNIKEVRKWTDACNNVVCEYIDKDNQKFRIADSVYKKIYKTLIEQKELI